MIVYVFLDKLLNYYPIHMKSIGKTFSSKPLENIIGKFQGILVEN